MKERKPKTEKILWHSAGVLATQKNGAIQSSTDGIQWHTMNKKETTAMIVLIAEQNEAMRTYSTLRKLKILDHFKAKSKNSKEYAQALRYLKRVYNSPPPPKKEAR